MSWIVIILKPNQSKKAEENLANQGFTAFFPKITYHYNEKLISKDLFSGYAFVLFDKSVNTHSINYTSGVSRIMRTNDSIPLLSDSVIKNINKQLKHLNSRFAAQFPFKINDQVVIKLKGLINQEAEVINVSNKKDSQKVLLKILNCSQTVWIDGMHLKIKQKCI